MATNTRQVRCAPEEIFAILGNGWLYPTWVVGAARMRDVDERWPREGSRLRHSVGAWPLLLDDITRCEVWDAPRRAIFIARGWPMGEARVTFDVSPSRAGCWVRIAEVGVRGPVAAIPRFMLDPLLRWRNREVLRRLAYIAEGGGAGSGGRNALTRGLGGPVVDPYAF